MSEVNGKHRGLPVAGYRPQTSTAVQLVNDNKSVEEFILRDLDKLKDNPEVDQRWLDVGRTGIEQAFMAINRAIFKPARIKFEGEQ